MPTVENAHASIYYEVHGEGPALVLAHGAGGNGAIWWQQIPFFVARGYRVITFDHRGFARSPCPPEELELAHFPTDLLAILDAEGIDRLFVIGPRADMGRDAAIAARQRFASELLPSLKRATPEPARA